ncbi:hypothetical protein ABT354_19385 [Streptomyces sp. NPDC000594]|uniref:hypothetical protein n=1 Tax=Streptomyces sp. NPDC000594 TaxID=3154261 RepID=UPI0033306639
MPAPDPHTTPRVLMIDMGGVFFSYSFIRALEHWARLAGDDPQRLLTAWEIDGPFDAFERGEITPPAYLDHLRHRLGLTLTDRDMTDGWNAIYQGVDTRLTALLSSSLVRDTFRAVVGVSNTNALHAPFWRDLYREDLTVLDAVICSHEIGTTKPRVAFFDHVAHLHHIPRSSLVLADDIASVTTDAGRLGIASHHYTGADQLAAFLTTL